MSEKIHIKPAYVSKSPNGVVAMRELLTQMKLDLIEQSFIKRFGTPKGDSKPKINQLVFRGGEEQYEWEGKPFLQIVKCDESGIKYCYIPENSDVESQMSNIIKD